MNATLPDLPKVVADMVRFERLTGCRPGEVCQLRPADLDRTGEVCTAKQSAAASKRRTTPFWRKPNVQA